MDKEIWLIRHGESEANAGLRSSDPATVPLTKTGYEQAERVSKYVVEEPTLIVCSPFLRTKQTAQPTITRYPNVNIVEWPIQEFTYLSPIACQNTTATERRPISKEYWAKNDPFYVHGEGAESISDLLIRVENTFDRIKKLENEFTLIFGHGQFIRTLLLSLMLGTFEPTQALMHKLSLYNKVFKIPNCAILKIKFHDRQPFISGLITNHLEDNNAF